MLSWVAVIALLLLLVIALVLLTDYGADLDGPITPKIKNAERLAISGSIHGPRMVRRGR